MKVSDQHHKWIEWSEEDQVYIGKCFDLITGTHGDDPVKLYSELCEVVVLLFSILKQKAKHFLRLALILCKKFFSNFTQITLD